MVSYPNFYQSLTEANRRLKGTVVLYDTQPYHILAIANHKDDIFRVYMEPLCPDIDSCRHLSPFDSITKNSGDSPSVGLLVEKFMAENPSRIFRKQINSPLFRKFRPFPLGMVNKDGTCFYLERSPVRRTEQGLISSSIMTKDVCVFRSQGYSKPPSLFSNEVADCIRGNYPTIDEVFENLNNPDISNKGVAFDRNLAIIRGPIEMLFLVYKSTVVGSFPYNHKSLLKLGKNFQYLREVLSFSGYFQEIV